MKKWIVVIIVFLVAAFIFLNFILSAPEKIAVNKNANISSENIYRAIANQQTWDKLFPGDFTVTKKLLNTIHINTNLKNKNSQGSIFLIPLANDSCSIHWESGIPVVAGYFNRIPGYFAARRLKNKLSLTLDSLASYCANTVNTYGMRIIQRSTADTFLVSTKFNTTAYPTSQDIYSHIEKLQKFVASKNAKQAGHPMLNVSTADSVTFKCMVGLPVDRLIETDYNSPITFVRMIPGQFLTAEIKGGPHTIRNAHKMMQRYFLDYKRTAMAIPFEYLVTDRTAEPDTSKWVTKLYAPVY